MGKLVNVDRVKFSQAACGDSPCQLHVFCDASVKAYAAVAYLVSEGQSQIVMSKVTDRLNDINLWPRRYDGIIFCIGGNDLSRLSVDEVFSKLCDLARRLRTQTTFLTVCSLPLSIDCILTIIDLELTKRRKVVTINRKIKHFRRSIDSKIIDLGRRCLTLQGVGDGVHFTVGGQNSFCHTLNKVIRAYVHRSSS